MEDILGSYPDIKYWNEAQDGCVERDKLNGKEMTGKNHAAVLSGRKGVGKGKFSRKGTSVNNAMS